MSRVALLVAALMAMPAAAVTGAVMERPFCDPCVPAAVKRSAVAAPSPEGAALRAQVEAKLRAPFEAAARDGVLTRDQARAAGLGFIDRHFDAIDATGRGAISFADFKRFLEARGAALR